MARDPILVEGPDAPSLARNSLSDGGLSPLWQRGWAGPARDIQAGGACTVYFAALGFSLGKPIAAS